VKSKFLNKEKKRMEISNIIDKVVVITGAPSFDLSEPEAYRRDVPKAGVHILDAGHFALDTKADEIAALIGQFMKRQK
jgi:hypothetical protein